MFYADMISSVKEAEMKIDWAYLRKG